MIQVSIISQLLFRMKALFWSWMDWGPFPLRSSLLMKTKQAKDAPCPAQGPTPGSYLLYPGFKKECPRNKNWAHLTLYYPSIGERISDPPICLFISCRCSDANICFNLMAVASDKILSCQKEVCRIQEEIAGSTDPVNGCSAIPRRVRINTCTCTWRMSLEWATSSHSDRNLF